MAKGHEIGIIAYVSYYSVYSGQLSANYFDWSEKCKFHKTSTTPLQKSNLCSNLFVHLSLSGFTFVQSGETTAKTTQAQNSSHSVANEIRLIISLKEKKNTYALKKTSKRLREQRMHIMQLHS